MDSDRPIRLIAIVGTGAIGASWAAQYLACGLDVIATDPATNAEENLRKYIDSAWPHLTAMGLAKNASRDRLTFTPDMKRPRAAGFQDQAVCRHGRSHSPRFDHCVELVGSDHERHSIRLQASGTLRHWASLQSSSHNSVSRGSGGGQDIARDNSKGDGVLCLDRKEADLSPKGVSRPCR
jgi:hypothetical protein